MKNNFKGGRARPGLVACCLLSSMMATAAYGQSLSELFQHHTGATYDSIQYPGSTPASAEAYGLVATSVLTLSPWAFEPIDDITFNTERTATNGLLLGCTSQCVLVTNISLPTGVKVVSMELDVHDSNDTGKVAAFLVRCPKMQSLCDFPTAVIDSGTPEVPGDALLVTDVGMTLLNDQYTYIASLLVEGASLADLGFRGLRIRYQRQISPAPGLATFSDVPNGAQFFAGIEALAASGITGGCGGGKFCPNDPVTRGQMATFLSRALGLHWPD